MSILLFIAVLCVLVLVHEWGHYFVAKRSGMRVDEFGIGFPPRLFGFKKGETLYSINSIPLGGFVKIYGEDADADATGEDTSRAFSSRPLYAQALVLVAGVTMNILFAWFLFAVAFSLGTESTVEEGAAGPTARLMVLSVLPGSPAEEAGIRPGDTILSVVNENGRPAEKLLPSTVSAFIQDHTAVSFSYLREGETIKKDISTKAGIVASDPNKKAVGITMGLMEKTSKSIHIAILDAGLYTVQSIGAVAVGIAGLFWDTLFLKADFSSVAGPVGIAGMVGDAAAFGFTSLLIFTAFISLNLAVINLLPFPALDGGRLLFVVIEAIKGSPISPRISGTMNAVGFVLLILLMVLVTFNDITKLF